MTQKIQQIPKIIIFLVQIHFQVCGKFSHRPSVQKLSLEEPQVEVEATRIPLSVILFGSTL